MCADVLGKVAVCARAHRAHVNPSDQERDREDDVGARRHGVERAVVEHRCDHDIGGSGDLPPGAAPLEAVADEAVSVGGEGRAANGGKSRLDRVRPAALG